MATLRICRFIEEKNTRKRQKLERNASQKRLLQKTTQERDKNDRVMPTTMKSIIKRDLPTAEANNNENHHEEGFAFCQIKCSAAPTEGCRHMQLWPPAGHFTWQHCWPCDRFMGGGNPRQCFILENQGDLRKGP